MVLMPAGKILRLTLFLTLCCLCRMAPGCRGYGQERPPETPETMEFGGKTRTYLLHVPHSHNKAKPAPLVLVFHGAGGNSSQMVRLTGFNELADKHGFVVAYLDGYKGNWNDGRGIQAWPAQRENIDDVSFVAALIEHLVKTLNVDRRRVYATGISNGGLISWRLACELSDKLAAVAPVARTLTGKMAAGCKPARPISVLMMMGVADPLVPWSGGEQEMGRGVKVKVLSAPETVAHWVKANDCAAKPTTTELPDKDPADGTRVRREVYGRCKGSTEVVLYAIDGGGHTWPRPKGMPALETDNAARRALTERLGKTSREINAGEVIWEFFASHKKNAGR